jgi:hypothetical protein
MAEMNPSDELSVWARVALAATGVVGTVVFFFLGFSSNVPIYGDSLKDWSSWAPTHSADAGYGVGMLFLTYLLYMVFAVYLTTVVRKSDPWTRFLAQLATVAIVAKFGIEIMQIAILNVATQVGSQNFDPSMAQLGQELSMFSLVPFAILLLAVGAAALISRAVPTWMAWFTLTVGVIHAFAMVLGLTGAGSLGPIMMAFGVVWFLSIPLWPLVMGVGLVVVAIRGSRPAARADSTFSVGQPA